MKRRDDLTEAQKRKTRLTVHLTLSIVFFICVMMFKWIDDKWLINIDGKQIPLGSEIVEINDTKIEKIIPELYKYYSTDGNNLTGKRIGLMTSFSKYYRLHYGLTKSFNISYINSSTKKLETKSVESIGNKAYFENFNKIHSMPLDVFRFANLKENQKYMTRF